MSDLSKILLTSFGSLVVFILGQVIIRRVYDPYIELHKLLGEIIGSLTIYGTAGSGIEKHYLARLPEVDPSDEPHKLSRANQMIVERNEALIRAEWQKSDTAATVYRTQSGQLEVCARAVWFYHWWSWFGWLPARGNLSEISRELIGLSNSVHDPHCWSQSFIRHSRIKDLLGMKENVPAPIPDLPRRGHRRFTLADGMILVAASAAAAWLSRWQGSLPPRPGPGGRFSALPYFHATQPWLASWIIGLLVCAVLSHYHGPRLQPGVRYRRPDWLVVSFMGLGWTYVASVFALIFFL